MYSILALGKPQATLSEETAAEIEAGQEEAKEEPRLVRPKSKKDSFPRSLSSADANNSSKKWHDIVFMNSVHTKLQVPKWT